MLSYSVSFFLQEWLIGKMETQDFDLEIVTANEREYTSIKNRPVTPH